jgi:alpha-amylase
MVKQGVESTLLRALVLLTCLLAFVGCAGGGSSASEQPTAGPAPPTAATPAPTQAASPVVAPPEVPPFPLEAGWWDSAVCYEVFVRSFYDSNGDGIGDLNGLIQKLDYINDGNPGAQKDLGANCIWLMPIAEATSYHGYDTIDYYAVERDYGTNDDFKRLVEEAHKRGIRVLLDLVLNHTGSDHPWFQEALRDPASPYRAYYIWSKQDPGYRGPWGAVAWHKSPVADEYYYGLFWDGMPDLDYRNPAVTAEAREISTFWLKEMGADGFRLDAIKHLIENGTVQENTPETLAWLRGYRAFLEQDAPGAFTVGEIFGATPTILKPYYPDQLDDYFIFDIGERIIDAANTSNGRQYTSAVQRVNGALPYQRFSPFLTNHDQDRVMALLGGDQGKAKVSAIALLTIPGLPFVYYGEEIGTTGTKPDEQLRTPMQWSGEAQGGFSAAAPWQGLQPNYAEVNVAAQDGDPDSLLNLYRRLIHLHTAHKALGQGDFTPFESSERSVAAFVRQADEEAIVVLINFSREAQQGVTLSLEASGLAPGTYRLEPLLGDAPGAELIVGEGGRLEGYMPLATLEARSGYIFKLTR